MKMKKSLTAAVLACALVGLFAQPVAAAPAEHNGTVSCEIFQKGGLKHKTQRDAWGVATGTKQFYYDWGTTVFKTYRSNGNGVGGGNWWVESSGSVDVAKSATNGYCW